jgi:hypothetical protein
MTCASLRCMKEAIEGSNYCTEHRPEIKGHMGLATVDPTGDSGEEVRDLLKDLGKKKSDSEIEG